VHSSASGSKNLWVLIGRTWIVSKHRVFGLVFRTISTQPISSVAQLRPGKVSSTNSVEDAHRYTQNHGDLRLPGFSSRCPMTDIEENTWQEGVCKHCGIRLRGEQRMLRLSDGFSKVYCSDYCRDQGLQTYLSRPVFEASRSMNLRDHILRASRR
jgi:hypothetical protein